MGFYCAPTHDGKDLRHVHCPKCDVDYCILCGRTWSTSSGSLHDGKACLEHGASFAKSSSDQTKWAGAKQCPGCGVRILRSMGCNHMTCTQCGYQLLGFQGKLGAAPLQLLVRRRT